MPQAPTLSPEEMQLQQAQGSGPGPANLLVAAASLHNEGALSMPSGPRNDPLKPSRGKKLKVIK
jgi:hypothetical protein